MRLPDTWKNARLTVAIAAVTAAVWLVLTLFGLNGWAGIGGAFLPARLAFGGDEGMVPFWLTPLTAAFLHADFLHLAFNLLMLVFCGRPVESVLGPVGMAILYVVGAYAAAAAQYALDPTAAVPMIGASGATSAVLGAYAMLFGRNKVKLASPRLALWLNALWLMAAWVILNAAVAFAVSMSLVGIQLAAGAHVGGFLVGILLAYPLLLLRYRGA
ncbi:MAG TPA: rhomboid family intramembrane serine protease [Allosphingosinicella sp.]|nr:rhomboid family intramembrane serine protease [Allosphingosinicella sp.]